MEMTLKRLQNSTGRIGSATNTTRFYRYNPGFYQ
ncbi:hypothetical protein Gohar_006720 [Gossypium harknessii]|uniref:Uncharacterized protein n=1 Tax=Gossypium harknessii TaxID=34285 RepID=A0A7J9GEB3_9ROSI|nr:hypothetical protein [Gossypium harknessii]MBA0795890.1 hypothetical protein [Gossypium harknessii]